VPRRLFRYVMVTSEDARMWVARDILRMPAPRLMAALFMPAIRRLAERSHANEAKVREALAELPAQLHEVDRLIAAGTIGGALPNAADFQILSTVRVLLEFEELAELMQGRASVPLARRLFPRWPGPAPRGLPLA
jgi:glutathione S-transferase